MPANTGRLTLPYPVGTDTVDVPRDILALANKLDPNTTIFAQGVASARPAAGVQGRLYYATDTVTISYDTGSVWVALAPTFPVVSTLPASPIDGQEIYYLADATNGVLWHLRYRLAAASPYRWECLGGGWLLLESAASWAFASPGVPGAEQVATALAPPLAGDYDVDFGGSISGNVAVADVQVKLRSSPVAGGSSVGTQSSQYANFDLAANQLVHVARTGKILGIPASQNVFWNFLRGVATTVTLTTTNRYIRMRPTRVG